MQTSDRTNPKSCVFRNTILDLMCVHVPTYKWKGEQRAVKQELFAFEQEWNVPDSHRFSMPDGTQSWCCRSVFEQHTAFKVRTSLSNQQVSTLPGRLSNFPCCAFASPFCKCSCYVNCDRHPPSGFVLFCCFLCLLLFNIHKAAQKLSALSHDL